MRKIVLTGGGTAGHVTPNLALVPELQRRGYEILYIGSKNGMEKQLAEAAGLRYEGVDSGKLRRYLDIKNLTDPIHVIRGYAEAIRILKAYQPDVVFSKGGFVAVPVVYAAGHLRIPVITHESDMTPGLANKLCLRYAKKICTNFPETLENLPAGKGVVTGCPIRAELFTGTAEAGREMTGFGTEKPVLLVIGGSLGSVRVNTAVRKVLPELLKHFQIVHCCGKGNLAPELEGTEGYVQYEYVTDPLKDLFAMADVVISRAGANAICELLSLKKPTLLIPLGADASRGDQILNARSFAGQGFSKVLEEETLTDELLLETILALYRDRQQYIDAMEQSRQGDAVTLIADLLDSSSF